MGIGQRTRKLREERGLIQKELADRAGLARNTVARIEQGRLAPSATTVSKLADALGVRPGDLFETPLALAPTQKRGRLLGKELARPLLILPLP